MKTTRGGAVGVVGMILALVIVGCAAPAASTASGGPKERAAAEATAIMERAEATAMVVRAEAAAADLIKRAGEVATTPVPLSVATPASAGARATAAAPGGEFPSASPMATPAPSTTSGETIVRYAVSTEVEMLSVSIGGEGGFIHVQFKAPVAVARKWAEGNVYVVDETSGVKYDSVAIVPVIGPLFARPKIEGQPGYVMFTNVGNAVKTGTIVTVVLGSHKWEHVVVQ